jgi:L-malate glycosyltransferase
MIQIHHQARAPIPDSTSKWSPSPGACNGPPCLRHDVSGCSEIGPRACIEDTVEIQSVSPYGKKPVVITKVILTIGQLHRGGTEGQLVLLAKGFKEAGVRVSVASLFDGGVHAEALERLGIPVYLGRFPRKNDRFKLLAFPMRFLEFVQWLRRERPDVVHSFLFHSYVLTAPAARLARVPVMIAGRRSLGTFKDGRKWASHVEKVATGMTTVIIANSQAVANDTIEREGLPSRKVLVVNNGLDESAFLPHQPTVIEKGVPNILSVANFRVYKGHIYLLEAAEKLVEKGYGFRLVLAGSASSKEDRQRQRELQTMATTAGIEARFLGSRSDVGSLLASANVFVLPSIAEGFSNSLLEAMAAGLPIVATDVGGNREALGDSGIIVPPRDARSLMVAIARLLDDPQYAADLGRRARVRALSNFSMTKTVETHLVIYESLLKRSSRFDL